MQNGSHSKDLESGDVSSIAGSVTSNWYSPSRWHPERNVIIRNVIIGFLDGITVPFSITAGLSTLGMRHLIIFGGVAELVAGAMSMAFGAWLAELTEKERYETEAKRLKRVFRENSENHDEEIIAALGKYGVGKAASKAVAEDLRGAERRRVKFIMDTTFQAERPRFVHSVFLAFAMGGAYCFGGLIPTLPYVFQESIKTALFISIALAIVTLTACGYLKSFLTLHSQTGALKSVMITLGIGALCGAVSYGLGVKAHKSSPKVIFAIDQQHMKG